MAQGGFCLDVPRPEPYYQLLQAHHVKIHAMRGVKIGGLWYDGPGLDPYRDGPSSRGGKHRRSWVIRNDRRDARTVFFQDPRTHEWHELRWTGLPADGDVPSFIDARVTEMLRAARAAGLKPRTDAELLPLLLKVLGGHIPVSQWPTQMSKQQKKEQAREIAQAGQAASDRPGPPAGASAARAGQAADAVDAERRRRREQAVPRRPAPPARPGERLRRTSLLLLPDDDL